MSTYDSGGRAAAPAVGAPAPRAQAGRNGGKGALQRLFDEPFSAVDAPTRQTLYRELAALHQGLAIPMVLVLVTHDQHEARRVAELVGMQNHFQGHFFFSKEPMTRPVLTV